MQEFIEKLIGRLEELEVQAYAKTDGGATYQTYRNVIEMVIQLAEEHKQQLSNDLEIISSLPSLYPLQPFEEEAIHRVVASVKNNSWIPCSERIPEDCDNRFYMCIVENHEEDLPMFCQYEEGYGFGFWHDIYDEHTLGFVDSEFKTNEELGYEKVIAWQPLPAPYQPKGE